MLSVLKEKLLQAQTRMKNYADQNRSERSFQVGDFVYLKLQPYTQSSLAHKASFKLAPRYYGPYEVVAKIGSVAYKLKLPAYAQIHDVFHVSLLKKKIGTQAAITPSLPPVTSDGRPKLVPVSILYQRMVNFQNRPKVEYLVHWANSAPKMLHGRMLNR